LHPEHAGIREVVVLDCLGLGVHVVIARAALFRGQRRDEERTGGGQNSGSGGAGHDTVIAFVSANSCPCSSAQIRVMSPLSLARRWKAKYGFAAMAGKISVRNTSSPL